MKHLHVLLTEEQYAAVSKYKQQHNISLALAVRYIIDQWKKSPKESPKKN